jgi:muramoyltetrapeptide carboxypeptidase LdcA involved in peptidoglycan recycling
MPVLRPMALRPGDTVAVAALSSGPDPEDRALLERGVQVIRDLGFDVLISPLVTFERSWWWSADRPAVIASELNRLLRDPDVRAIVALAGGRTTMSYLDLVDYDAVRADPKPLLGLSDIDVLLLAVHSQTGLASIHAHDVLDGFGEFPEEPDAWHQALADLYRRLLTSTDAPGALTPRGSCATWRPGRASGPLIGGLLNRLLAVQATPFAVPPERFDGAILFWEELATSTSAIWNGLHVLRQAGVLDRISGMIVGTPTEVTQAPGGPELREVVLDVIGDRDIPVLGEVEIGHQPPNLPLPLGIRAEMDADARTLSLVEPVVS